MNPQTVGPLIGIGVAVAMILLRNRQPRRLDPDRMWILPLIMITLLGFGIWGLTTQFRPAFDANADITLVSALLLGAVLGWWRGKTIHIHRDEATGALMAQASPLGIAFILVLFGVRYAGHDFLETNAVRWGLQVGIIDIAFLLLAGGLLIVSRIEMWFRAKTITETGTDPIVV